MIFRRALQSAVSRRVHIYIVLYCIILNSSSRCCIHYNNVCSSRTRGPGTGVTAIVVLLRLLFIADYYYHLLLFFFSANNAVRDRHKYVDCVRYVRVYVHRHHINNTTAI